MKSSSVTCFGAGFLCRPPDNLCISDFWLSTSQIVLQGPSYPQVGFACDKLSDLKYCL